MPTIRPTSRPVVTPQRDATPPTLRRGAVGQDVKTLQKLLGQTQDGKFGPNTEADLKSFQRSHGLKADGVAGPATWSALRNGASPSQPSTPSQPSPSWQPSAPGNVTPAPANATERQKFDHYAAIVRAAGGQVNPGGKPTVLAIRQGGNAAAFSYKDKMVVLTPDGHVKEFKGGTVPGQKTSSMAQDANRDGVKDVGVIRPGNYTAVPHGDHNGLPSFHILKSGGDSIPAWRDTNHDGVFSAAERAASERRGDTAGAILVHAGFADRPKSIGCQTMSPADMKKFIAAVGGRNGSFNYTLVEG